MKENEKKNREYPRIGVFVCDCGSNIAGHVDCAEVAAYASTLPYVVYVKENLYTCSESGITQIKSAIKEQQLTRVVVASCSPRTHHPLFAASCAEAGLNPYLFEMVNIRDQCSWVHMGKRSVATQKAKELVRMGVAKSVGLEPQKEIESGLTRKVLVIGGGVAGLSAAQSLCDMELDVVLVEKSAALGGLLRQIDRLDTGEPAQEMIKDLVDDVTGRDNIKIYTKSVVKQTGGYIGNYDIVIDTPDGEKTDKVGCIVIAAGAVPLQPKGIFGYNGKSVITLLELENRLKNNEFNADRITFIQCAGARTREKEYCSRICCMTAVKNAIRIKKDNPLAQVRILYRDMQMYGTHKEQMLWDARGMGIRFDVYSPERPPRVEKDGTVQLYQTVTGKEVTYASDLVVLSTPMIPRSSNAQLASLMRVPTDQNGFFLEAHAKLRPLDFAADGNFVCGSCRYPATAVEARTQGIGVASRAAAILFKDKLVKSAIVARVNPDTCVGCTACLSVCPYAAVEYDDQSRTCRINEILCKGCGNCTAACPCHSVVLSGFKPDQLLAQIGAV